jgi:hypothetical protein
MLGFELVEEFAGRADSSFHNVIKSLADAFMNIGLSRDVEQSLVGGGVLNDGSCLSVDSQHYGALCSPELFDEIA